MTKNVSTEVSGGQYTVVYMTKNISIGVSVRWTVQFMNKIFLLVCQVDSLSIWLT